MTFALPSADRIAERTLKNTARLLHQGMWLLFVIAAALMFILRRSVPARTGSLWILGCGILAFMLSFALRDVVRKVGHRNTEDRIVKDVRAFLESEPVHEEKRYTLSSPAVQEAAPPADLIPSRPADFLALKGTSPLSTPAGEPVVFDAIPSREPVVFRMDFYAVLQPVAHTC